MNLADHSDLRRSIRDAIAQLRASERGCAAALRFHELLDADAGYALGLDSANWRALETLVRGCRQGIGPEIRDELARDPSE
jgi:hypothetical protein